MPSQTRLAMTSIAQAMTAPLMRQRRRLAKPMMPAKSSAQLAAKVLWPEGKL